MASLKKEVEAAKSILWEVSIERDGKISFDEFVEVMKRLELESKKQEEEIISE